MAQALQVVQALQALARTRASERSLQRAVRRWTAATANRPARMCSAAARTTAQAKQGLRFLHNREARPAWQVAREAREAREPSVREMRATEVHVLTLLLPLPLRQGRRETT